MASYTARLYASRHDLHVWQSIKNGPSCTQHDLLSTSRELLFTVTEVQRLTVLFILFGRPAHLNYNVKLNNLSVLLWQSVYPPPVWCSGELCDCLWLFEVSLKIDLQWCPTLSENVVSSSNLPKGKGHNEFNPVSSKCSFVRIRKKQDGGRLPQVNPMASPKIDFNKAKNWKEKENGRRKLELRDHH